MFEKLVNRKYMSLEVRNSHLEVLGNQEDVDSMIDKLNLTAKYGGQATILFTVNFLMLSVIGAVWSGSLVPLWSNLFLIVVFVAGFSVTYSAELALKAYNDDLKDKSCNETSKNFKKEDEDG